jgi:hypothetical protein
MISTRIGEPLFRKKLTRREYLNASALVERDDSEEIIAPRFMIISSSQSHH